VSKKIMRTMPLGEILAKAKTLLQPEELYRIPDICDELQLSGRSFEKRAQRRGLLFFDPDKGHIPCVRGKDLLRLVEQTIQNLSKPSVIAFVKKSQERMSKSGGHTPTDARSPMKSPGRDMPLEERKSKMKSPPRRVCFSTPQAAPGPLQLMDTALEVYNRLYLDLARQPPDVQGSVVLALFRAFRRTNGDKT